MSFDRTYKQTLLKRLLLYIFTSLENCTFIKKLNPLNFKPNLKHFFGASEFPVKIWGKSVKGFPNYDRTCGQTNKDYYFIFINIRITYLMIFVGNWTAWTGKREQKSWNRWNCWTSEPNDSAVWESQ